MIQFHVRGKLVGKNGNQRGHWAIKARQYKSERARVHGAALVHLGPGYAHQLRAVGFPCVVTITRRGPSLLDTDNLGAACAAIRDELAVILGITDAPTDTRAEWRVAQEKGEYGCIVRIEPAARKTEAA